MLLDQPRVSRDVCIAWNGQCNWPRDAAFRVFDGTRYHYITWEQVHAERSERQKRELERKLVVEPPRVMPAYVWTFYNPHWIYMGWHCYVVTLRDQTSVTFRHMNARLAESIMKAIPCGLLPLVANFEAWMVAFTKQHRRAKTKRDRRKAGSAIGWYDRDQGRFTLERPS